MTKRKGEEGLNMQRYLLVHEYVGQAFCGWQKQPKGIKTVQSVIEKALSDFIGSEVIVLGSSRTDTGVHGLGNTCHVDLCRKPREGKEEEACAPYDACDIKKAVNARMCGEQVFITKVLKVDADFHARFNAKGRTYFYRIASSTSERQLSLFHHGQTWNVRKKLDINLMREAAKALVGTHDFSSFRASGCQALSPVKSLDSLEVEEKQATWFGRYNYDEETQKQHILVTASAPSFLYHQVRLMVGLLKAVGTGEIPLSRVQEILDAKDIRKLRAAMAPAHGLYLASVDY